MNEASPFPLEDYLASLVEALKMRGDARAIATVIEGNCQFVYYDTDFGVDYWNLVIGIPVHIFHALSDDEQSLTAKVIEEVGGSFFASLPKDSLNRVVLTPKVVPATESWRTEALRFVKGEGLTNQGRVRSDNIASQQHQGLLFRSKAEIMLFESMTRKKLAVAPLPVFVRIGKTYNRIEPDFVVVYKGLTFIVEVDGDTFHKELPADADKRLLPLTFEGVEVRRIRANDLQTRELADAAVDDFIQFMSRRKESR